MLLRYSWAAAIESWWSVVDEFRNPWLYKGGPQESSTDGGLFEINLVLATRAKPRRNTAFDGEKSGSKAQDCVEMGYEQMDWG